MHGLPKNDQAQYFKNQRIIQRFVTKKMCLFEYFLLVTEVCVKSFATPCIIVSFRGSKIFLIKVKETYFKIGHRR